MNAARIVFVVLFATACRYDAPYVVVHVTAGAEVSTVVQLQVTTMDSEGPGAFGVPSVAAASPLVWPRSFTIALPRATEGTLALAMNGVDSAGTIVATGTGSVPVHGNGVYAVSVALATSMTAPAHCYDGIEGVDETDVDCGGACPPCDAFLKCSVPADCITGICTGTTCDVVTGPPFWIPTKNPLPQPCAYLTAVSYSQGDIFTLGGSSTDSGSPDCTDTFDYDPFPNNTTDDGTWSTSGAFVHPRLGPGGAALGNGDVVMVSGVDGTATLDPSFERLVGAKPPWVLGTGVLSSAREFGTALYGNDNLFMVGGRVGGNVTASMESYNTVTNTAWAPSVGLPAGRENMASAYTPLPKFFVFGGDTGGTSGAEPDVWSFSPGMTEWQPETKMTNPRTAAGGAYASDQRIYVVGGHTGSTALGTTVVDAYVPTLGTWSAVAPLNTPRTHLGVAIAGDGRVYAIGGLDGSGTALATVEAYGPIMKLSTLHAPAGTSISASGSNFAANATVTFTLETETPTLLGTGTTDASGALAPVALAIPSVPETCCGYALHAVDSKSRYTVQAHFVVDSN